MTGRGATVAAVVFVVVVSTSVGALAKSLPAAEWAPKFCTAISTFQQHLTDDGTQADAVLSGDITSLAKAKSALATFMSKAVRDAEVATSALQRAGVPDTANGPKIAARFATGFQTLRSLYVSARTNAQHLPTKNLGGFETATKKITSALEKGARDLTASFASIQSLDTSGKLGAALRAEPTCAFLNNA